MKIIYKVGYITGLSISSQMQGLYLAKGYGFFSAHHMIFWLFACIFMFLIYKEMD